MSNDFYQSETFKALLEGIQQKFGTIESFTVCHGFETPEKIEQECPEDEQLEVEYPGPDSFWCDDTEYQARYLDGVILVYTPVYEQEDLDDCLDYDEVAYLQGDYDEEVYEDRVKHEIEHPLAKADREAEERMNIPPSPHLSQPDEDFEL